VYVRPTLIAHRGASGAAPEHTTAAYELAIRHGAQYVEPDLQFTKDGVLVCLHDASLERTTDVAAVFPDRAKIVKDKKGDKKTWPVLDFTMAEIERLDAGSWKSPTYKGERVLTFEQMIRLAKGRIGILIEMKTNPINARRGFDMEAATMAALKANALDRPGADPKTPVVIQSFDEASLKRIRRECGCKLPIVFLMRAKDSEPGRIKEIAAFADGIGPNKDELLKRPDMVKEAHDLGLSVSVWTFRKAKPGAFPTVRDEMKHFLNDIGIDAVITDDPEEFPR
jgi:glycerophosphoryl diester phosphodiesterase